MATFSQHHVDGLDLALTPLQYMLKCFPLTKDQEQRCAPSPRWDGGCHGLASPIMGVHGSAARTP